jgi:uncharacterized protein YbaR (Trm112 family)
VFIELLDLLRCPQPHDDTWLVASFNNVNNRFVETGTLGCPICGTQYPIAAGVVDFSGGLTVPSCDQSRSAANHRREELATRAGAFLDATEPGATVVLGGVWAYAAEELSELAEVRVIALNAEPDVKETASVGLVRVATEVPVAADSCLGVAIDTWFNSAIVDAAVRAVRPGGRVVGPSAIAPPVELAVLAQDADYWVARKTPTLIPLRKASR